MRIRPAVLLLALAACLSLSACAVQADLANTPTLYVDEPVARAWTPQISLRPENPPLQPLNAVLFPFHIRQAFSYRAQISEELTRVFWNTWLEKRVFPGLAFAQGEKWRKPGPAMDTTWSTGADLAVGGEITHIMFGGASGTTEISLRVDIYDAATGTLLWSMAHSGQLRNAKTGDYIVLTKKSRLPTEPTGAVMAALARDMAGPVKDWNHGQPEPDEDTGSPLE